MNLEKFRKRFAGNCVEYSRESYGRDFISVGDFLKGRQIRAMRKSMKMKSVKNKERAER